MIIFDQARRGKLTSVTLYQKLNNNKSYTLRTYSALFDIFYESLYEVGIF